MTTGVFPSKIEIHTLDRLFNSISNSTYTVLKDMTMNCKHCNRDEDCTYPIPRVISIFSLRNPQIKVWALHIFCARCEELSNFDEKFVGLFCCSKHFACLRNIFDVLLYNVAGLGMISRSSFESLSHIFRMMKELEFLGNKRSPSVSWGRMNTCFTFFLKVFRFDSRPSLRKLSLFAKLVAKLWETEKQNINPL